MNITFEEAVRGASKKLELNVIDACAKCIGTGVEPGYKKVSCPYCNGTGVLSQYRDGFFMQTTCNRCGGQGSFNKASAGWKGGMKNGVSNEGLFRTRALSARATASQYRGSLWRWASPQGWTTSRLCGHRSGRPQSTSHSTSPLRSGIVGRR